MAGSDSIHGRERPAGRKRPSPELLAIITIERAKRMSTAEKAATADAALSTEILERLRELLPDLTEGELLAHALAEIAVRRAMRQR